MILDIISANKWKRPIYFSIGMGPENYLGLEKYFQLEGAAYRIVPIESKTSYGLYGRINSDLLYDNLMNKFDFGRIKEPDVYMDQFHIITCGIMSFRTNFARLAGKLNDENKKAKAIEVLDRCMEELPIRQLPIDRTMITFVQEYYKAGAIKKANALLKTLADNSYEKVEYYLSLDSDYSDYIKREVRNVQMMLSLADMGKQTELKESIQRDFEGLFELYHK